MNVLTLANTISTFLIQRPWLIGLLAVAVNVLLNGYRFGIEDHQIYLPYWQKWLNPELYSRDVMMELQASHTTFFPYLFSPLLSFLSMETIFFIFFYLFLWIQGWLYAIFVREYFGSSSAMIWVPLILAVPKFLPFFISSSHFIFVPTIIGNVVLTWLFILWKRKQHRKASLVTGLLANIHLLSALMAGLLWLGAIWVDRKDKGLAWRSVLQNASLMLLGALPVLVWRLQAPAQGGGWSIDEGWVEFRRRFFLQYTNFIPDSTDFVEGHGELLALGLLAFVLWFLVSMLILKPWLRKRFASRTYQLWLHWINIIWILLLFAGLIYEYAPITALLQPQLLRTAGLLAWLAVIPLIAWLCQKSIKANGLESIIYSAMLLSAIFIQDLGVWLMLSFCILSLLPQIKRWKMFYQPLVLCLACLLCVESLRSIKKWTFAFNTDHSPTAKVQQWLYQHTAQDSLVAVPPSERLDFRYHSQRSLVVHFWDYNQVGYYPDHLAYYQQTMNDFSHNRYDAFMRAGGHASDAYTDIIKLGFLALDEVDLQTLQEKYEFDYLITYPEHHLALERLYEDKNFVVYAVAQSP